MDKEESRTELLETIKRYDRENEAEWNRIMDMLAKCKDLDGDIVLLIYADELTKTHLALRRIEEEVRKDERGRFQRDTPNKIR